MPNGDEIGPTGRFPKGKLSPEDKGELAIAIGADEEKGVIVIRFGKPMSWIAMYPDEAVALADDLLNKAHKLSELKGEGNNGTQKL